MNDPKPLTPEGIALYRKLQMENAAGVLEEEFEMWKRNLTKRKAEVLGVPEHVIAEEEEAEAAALKAYEDECDREEEEFRKLHLVVRVGRRWEPDPRQRPIPRWPREDPPAEGK